MPYAATRYERVRARIDAVLKGGPKAHRIPARWARRPRLPFDEPLCVFVALARGTRILPHSVDHARAWREAGFRLLVVVVVGSLDDPVDLSPLDFADAVLLRVNRGYDFGAWAAAIRSLGPEVRRYPMLAIANDSVLGPSSNFASVLERAGRSDADLVGLVESNERARHFQSFALLFKPRALRSRAFARFWKSVRSGGREFVVNNYEVMMRIRLQAAGLRTEALYPAAEGVWLNPTIQDWRALLSGGFPYLKVELLRDDPKNSGLSGWRERAAQAGFDMARIDRQLAALEELAPRPWVYRDADPV